MCWWLGSPVQRADRSSRRSFQPLVPSRDFQATCLALSSPAIRAGNTPPKQAVKSAPISGRKKRSRKDYNLDVGQCDLNCCSL